MNTCWRALLLCTLKTCFVSLARVSCPPNQYYEPHKGCRSCTYVCSGAENSYECRFNCPNYGIDDKGDEGKDAVTTAGIKSGIASSQKTPTVVTDIVTSIVISLADGIGTDEGNDDDETDGIESGVTSSQSAPVNVVTTMVIIVIVLVLVATVVGSIFWYRRSNRRVDGREGFRTIRLVRNPQGEFVEEEPNAQSQTSISQLYFDQRSLTDSLLRSGSEEDIPEEESIGSSFQTPTVAGPRTHRSITEITDSDHKTEFDNNILRSHDSKTTPREECRPLSSQNTSSYSVVNDNNSNNGYPLDLGETLLKSPFTTESPDSDRFSVDAAMSVSVIGYSHEATTEENSQPAPNSLPSIHVFMPPQAGSLNQNALRNLYGIEVVN